MTRRSKYNALRIVEFSMAALAVIVLIALLTRTSRGDETPQQVAASRFESAYQILFGDFDPPPPRTEAEIDAHAAAIIAIFRDPPGEQLSKLFYALWPANLLLINAEAAVSQDQGPGEVAAKLAAIQSRADAVTQDTILAGEMEVLALQASYVSEQHHEQFDVLLAGYVAWEDAQIAWSEYYHNVGWDHLHEVFVAITSSQAAGRNVAAGIKSFNVTHELCDGLLAPLEAIEDEVDP